MTNAPATTISRRTFIAGTGAVGLSLTMCRLGKSDDSKVAASVLPPLDPVEPVVYDDGSAIYRRRWEWDRVAKGTHTRTNCIAACSWDVFVKDGVVWRE